MNAAVVDISRNRLIYLDDAHGNDGPAYAFSLAGLQLLPNAATQVTVSSLGSWPGGNDNAAYNKANGQIYYHVFDSEEVRTLNFDSSGNISGYTTVGTLNGIFTSTIISGDMDFNSNGTLWVSGVNSASNPRLWSFDPTTLSEIQTKNPPENYPGIVFDATGTTLYGYDGRYGIIDQSTGGYQTILSTDSTLFGGAGDLAEGMETIVVPEPSSLGIMFATVVALRTCRRNHSR